MTGCFAFYHHYPVKVSVDDAETNQPIRDAVVSIQYPYLFTFNPPKNTDDVTDEHGQVIVSAATTTPTFGIHWETTAKGYLTSRWYGEERANAKKTVRLYREPAPVIRIIVPVGYHGPLMIEFLPVHAWVQDKVGQRKFTFRLSPSGYVAILATPLLLDEWNRKFRFLYENGTALPDLDYYQHFTDYGNRLLYVVGTEQDEKAVMSIIIDPTDNNTFNEKAFNALFVGARTRTTQPSP